MNIYNYKHLREWSSIRLFLPVIRKDTLAQPPGFTTEYK